MKPGTFSSRLALAGALVLSPGLALAAPSAAEKAAAEALFQEGAALVERGEYATACEKLAASQELDPALGTLLRLGDCYDRLGKTASAWASFKQAASLAQSSDQAEREVIASERAADLERRLSRVVLVVRDPKLASAGARVQLGGVTIPPASWGSPLPVDPGRQWIEVTAPGYEPWSSELHVPSGPATRELVVPALEPLQTARVAAPALALSGPRRSEASEPGSGQRTAGYVIGGAGIVSLAAGGVLAFLAYDKNDRSLDQCLREDPNACSVEGKALRDDAASYAMLANVGVGAGAALLLTGGVLLLTAPSTERNEAASSVALSGGVTPDKIAVQLKGAF